MRRTAAALAALLGLLAAAPRAGRLPGLVAGWNFNEGRGRRAEDLLGRLPAEFRGEPRWSDQAAPVAGNRFCVEFSPESRDCLAVPAQDLPDPDGDFTVEAWVRPESDPPTWLRALACLRDGHGFQLCFGYRGTVVFAVWRHGARTQVRHGGHPPSQWMHVAGVWEAETDTARLFIDGVEVADNAPGSALAVDTGRELLIGTRGDDQGYFHGAIDQVRLWDYARTGDHIRVHYRRQMDDEPQGSAPRTAPRTRAAR